MRIRLSLTTLQTTCILVILAWVLSPPLAYSSVARLLCVLAAALWGVIEFAKPRGAFRAPTLPMILLILFFLYTLTFEYLTHGASGIISRLQFYIMLFFFVVYVAYRNAPKQLHFLFWVVVLLYAVWMTTTFIFLSTVDARAMRTLVRTSDASQDLTSEGVGGLAMAYNAALLFPVLLVLSLKPALVASLNPPSLLRAVSRGPVLVIWYLTALSALIVISSQFSIAVLTMLISTLSVIVLWRFSVARIILALFLSVIIIGFGGAFIVTVLKALLPYAEGTNYALKINDLLATLELGHATGTANDRGERYLRSLFTFLESPFIGALYYTDVGKHSTVLDLFARWGVVVGAIFLYIATFIPRKYWRGSFSVPGGFGLVLGALVATLAVLTLNKGVAATGAVLFLVYPALMKAVAQSGQAAKRAATIRNEAANA